MHYLLPDKVIADRGIAHRTARSGFTLVELMAATAVLAVLMSLLYGTLNQTARTVTQASKKVEAFQNARAAFDSLVQNLSQATLATYWDYDNPNTPTRYIRKSDLHFLIDPTESPVNGSHAIFFQAPLSRSSNTPGMQSLLNAVGYYVEFGDDAGFIPKLTGLSPKSRYRLMQAIQPTEELEVYAATGKAWVTKVKDHAWPLADNIICLVAWPRVSEKEDPTGTYLTNNYSYDSRANSTNVPQPKTAHQLPPVLQITMIALDSTSAARIEPNDINTLLSGKFTNVTSYETDIEDVKSGLNNLRANYRVFSSAVPMRESKWSD